MIESERTKTEVFLSDHSEGRDEARSLWEALERQGLVVFVDDRSIEVHDGLSETIDADRSRPAHLDRCLSTV